MTYSCSDFADDIIGALHVDIPEAIYDSPSEQADLCLAEIERLQTAHSTVYILQSEHWYIPGSPMAVHVTKASADKAAAELVNILRQDMKMKPTATATNWRRRLAAARRVRARQMEMPYDQLDGDVSNGDVWITEMAVTP